MTFDDELNELFTSPPATFGPTPLWWWSGERVTQERLEWQLHRFHEGGIDNLVVINLAPAGPLFGAPADDPQWFSEEWWDRFSDACNVAESLNMHLWFYDQIGFSGANVQGRVTHDHPEMTGRTLRSRIARVRDGRVDCASGGVPVAAYDKNGRRYDVFPEGRVDSADGDELMVVSSHPTAFDYLSPQAVDLLLDTVHREFERRLPQHLGSVIAGSFQDELPSTNPWTPRFPEEFLARKGYDLLDHLPALFDRGGTSEAKVRGDYYAVRTELTEEALFRPLADWHRRHNMLIGADQSNPARAGYPLQSTQIYTDYWRTHRWYPAVGSDHEGDSKVHSSMAHLYGHDRVWLEAFHSSGWGGTLEDTWDWLLPFLRSGATLYNPHASYYSTVGGWFEWAPPSTDWRQPYWRNYPAFSRAVARVAALMSWGTYQADVAVLHPTTTMQAGLPLGLPIDHFLDSSLGPEFADLEQTQGTYLELVGTNDWFRSRPGLLDRHGIAFDVIDDASIQRAETSSGRLQVADQAYNTLVVPAAAFLEEATARALVAFMDAGGRVVLVGDSPRFAAGRHGDDAIVTGLGDHAQCVHVLDPAAVPELATLEQHASADTPLLLRRAGDTTVALLGGAFPNASSYPLRTEPGSHRWHDYDFDRNRYASHQAIRVQGLVAEAEVWDPARGTRSPAQVHVHGNHSVITADSGGAPMVLVVWREGTTPEIRPTAEHAAAPNASPTLENPVDISDGWTGELVPTLDNVWGDFARPVGRNLTALQVWTLMAREGEADWAETKVTVGQRVLIHPPATPDNLPEPLTPRQCAQISRGAPLGGQGWETHQHSASRGRVRDAVGALGTKGAVPAEFLIGPDPQPGQQLAVRTLVITDHRGPADLVVSSSADSVAWWNGVRLEQGAGYVTTMPVTVDGRVNVLEYRLGPSRSVDQMGGDPTVRSSFTLALPGGYAKRPEYMVYGDDQARPNGLITFRSIIPRVSDLRQANLVVGSACAATVVINGTVVARQETVEYYESAWGANPAFFNHEVARHLNGDDTLEIRLETADARDVAYVDLALVGESEIITVVSGVGWDCETDGTTAVSKVTPRQWSPLDSAFAVRRPHPLPEADWLRGAPEIGVPAIPFSATDSADPEVQEFRVGLPAGTRLLDLPLRVDARVELDGAVLSTDQRGRIMLPAPLDAPAVLNVTTQATAEYRGGAAWAGPIQIQHEQAPIALADWRSVELASWSGGVRYRRTVDVPPGRRWTLDLGGLRGSVELRVDGLPAGEAFCAPFRFDLDPADGPVEVEVTVYNTLGPFLHESTPTTWVFPSQLTSGLFGPVTVNVHPV